MRKQFIDFNLRRHRFATTLITLLVIICTLTINLLILPDPAIAFRLSQATRNSIPSSNSQMTFMPIVAASPTAPISTNANGATTSQDSQAQQKLSEGQNDLSIANNVVTLAGIVIALAGLVLTFIAIGGALAGFLGFQEFRRIRRLRTRFEKEVVKNVSTVEEQVKKYHEQLAQLTHDFESKSQTLEELLRKLNERYENESQTFESRLAQLSSAFESKRFLDASYSYNEGTRAYKIGDNILAIEHYKRALDLQPDNIRIMERLGKAYSNLNDLENAKKYLDQALQIDPQNLLALHTLSLYYRYIDKSRSIEYLKRCTQIDVFDYEAWDFLGLLYRDQKLIDEAIAAHEEALKALKIKKRPETQFYLGILLLYSPNGDKIRAKSLMVSAYEGTLEQEHDLRIRPVWKILIHAGIPILDGKKEEALELIQTLTPYITTQRIHDALKGHLQFLLEGTDHKEWIPEFMEIVKLKEM